MKIKRSAIEGEHTFTHRASPPWTYDPTRTYKQTEEAPKPRGLWLSVDGDWERWLRSEHLYDEWYTGDRATVTSFDVDVSRVLWISDVEGLDQFQAMYVEKHMSDRRLACHFNWQPLTEMFAGIVIAPYIPERRYSGGRASEWYYPYDCASACIWDLSAVSVKELARDLNQLTT